MRMDLDLRDTHREYVQWLLRHNPELAALEPTWEDAATRAATDFARAHKDTYPSGLSLAVEEELGHTDLSIIREVLDGFIDFYDNGGAIVPLNAEAYFMLLGNATILTASQSIHTPCLPAGKMVELIASKQHDYGPTNITRFGVQGLLVRLHDKVARLENLSKRRDTSAKNESVFDTLNDIVGYCLIGVMLLRGQFDTLPLKADLEAHQKRVVDEGTETLRQAYASIPLVGTFVVGTGNLSDFIDSEQESAFSFLDRLADAWIDCPDEVDTPEPKKLVDVLAHYQDELQKHIFRTPGFDDADQDFANRGFDTPGEYYAYQDAVDAQVDKENPA
jgi:hypothetical protein